MAESANNARLEIIISEQLKSRLRKRAAQEHKTMSTVIKDLIFKWVESKDRKYGKK